MNFLKNKSSKFLNLYVKHKIKDDIKEENQNGNNHEAKVKENIYLKEDILNCLNVDNEIVPGISNENILDFIKEDSLILFSKQWKYNFSFFHDDLFSMAVFWTYIDEKSKFFIIIKNLNFFYLQNLKTNKKILKFSV